MLSVMIVEDEFLVRAGLRTSIDWEKEGFEIVAEAKDGEEALELYQKYHPLLVVTDIRLPKLDGIAMMKELRKQKEKVRFIVISAYDDFQYAKESISLGVTAYFLKGNLNVEEFLETLRILRSEYRVENRGESHAEQYTIRELYRNPEKPELSGKERFLLYFYAEKVNHDMLEAMILDLFAQHGMECGKLADDHGSWFWYQAKPGMEERVVKEISLMFQRYVDEEITLVKSRELSEYPDFRDAVYHTLLLHEYTRCPDIRKSFQTRGDKRDAQQNIRNIENGLIENLKFQNYEKAGECLEQLKQAIILSKSPEVLFESIYRLMGFFAEQDEDMIAARSYENLMSSLDLEYIFQTVAIFIENLKERKVDNSNYYIVKAREYIKSHMSEGIRIRDISDYVHVSPNYLGKIFFLNTGEHLRDYINSVKMERAKELLLTRKYQIGEVADLIGIEDQRYFSKLFRKYYGTSPREYGKKQS